MPTDPVVHLIFKTHLDIGFSDSAANVIHTYLTQFIPQAVALAQRTRDSDARFRWTVGAWMLYEYLEKATPDQQREMEQAIETGNILWHALPFTTHTELADESLFRYGLTYSQRLDRRFGRMTIAAKMTDVPGHTRSMIPLMAEAGIRLLHIGVNEASTVPDVPPVFVWREPDSGAEVVVIYNESYGDVTQVAGLNDALAMVLTNDNLGPPAEAEIRQTYREVGEHIPSARIIASSLDEFARVLDTVRGTLPVITSEIGDTWIHGAGSDPTKLRRYRELSRLRREWLQRSLDDEQHQRIDQFSHHLFMIPEHSWGMDEKTFLKDHTHYSTDELAQLRQTEAGKLFESSWAEKRAFIDTAVAALGGSPLADEARAHLSQVEPREPDLSAFTPTTDFSLRTSALDVTFDPATGAISQLTHQPSATMWADATHPLALLRYESYSAADYARFWEQYNRNKDREDVVWWAREDFTKPGLETEEHGDWLPTVRAAYRQGDARLLFELTLPEASHEFGAPKRLFLDYAIDANDPGKLDVTLSWFDKPANRRPEAFWLSFSPPTQQPEGWRLQKMGRWIDPRDVVSRGGRTLHAVDQKALYRDGAKRFELTTLDAVLVAPGQRALLDWHNRLPDMSGGIHVNLYNNIWGTNFPMWFEDDALFRFELRIE